ncbi:MAG: hypothetical protein A2044_06260 [Candidatus Firestonebacteria bacterium GWA2_43_8]|nr:MAG: hypothetical protein A2044_06260 [Candidatus Firestonebacteria bacterium GWA2_43_8]
MSMDDIRLFRDLLKGDEQAFSDLFVKYEKYVFFVIKGIVKLDHDAQDLTQQVFIKIYKNAGDFRGEAKPSTWIFRIAKNLALNFIRDRKKTEELHPGIAEAGHSVEDAYYKNETEKKMGEALKKLSEKYSEPLKMFYYDDMKYEDIALELNIPVNTVKTNISRGKKELAEIMKSG